MTKLQLLFVLDNLSPTEEGTGHEVFATRVTQASGARRCHLNYQVNYNDWTTYLRLINLLAPGPPFLRVFF